MSRENIRTVLRRYNRNAFDGAIIEKFNNEYYIWGSEARMYYLSNLKVEELSCYVLNEHNYQSFKNYLDKNEIRHCTIALNPPITKKTGIQFIDMPKPLKSVVESKSTGDVSPTNNNYDNPKLKSINLESVKVFFKREFDYVLDETVLIEKVANEEKYRVYELDALIFSKVFGRAVKQVFTLNKMEYLDFTSNLKSQNVYYFVFSISEVKKMPFINITTFHDRKFNQYTKFVEEILDPKVTDENDAFKKLKEEGEKSNFAQVKEKQRTKERLKNSPPTDKPTMQDMQEARRKDFFKR